MRKPDCKNANKMSSRGKQVSVLAQENLKLAAFSFHHRRRCALDWEIMEVHEGTVCLLAGQKKLEDEYNDPNVLPKINELEALKEYLRSCHVVVRAPLAYIIRKNMLVKTYGDYPKDANP